MLQRKIGLGKVKFSSSVCEIVLDQGIDSMRLILTERWTRKKSDGSWPALALKKILEESKVQVQAFENRDVDHPYLYEQALNKSFPFQESMKAKGLEAYLSQSHSGIKFITHHLAHAHVARFFSPNEKAIVLVFDGAGSKAKDFDHVHQERNFCHQIDPEAHEEKSIYLLDHDQLRCVSKTWQKFKKHGDHFISDSLGILFETVAEYIFNSNQAAGKVMGLAPYGNPRPIMSAESFLENLDWSKSFKGTTKDQWEKSENIELYKDIAASIQLFFEQQLMSIVHEMKNKYPDYQDLILVGGCALNCKANGVINQEGLFQSISVPPCPGDGGISLGCAYSEIHEDSFRKFDRQTSFWGSPESVPENFDIPMIFSNYKVCKYDPSFSEIVDLLLNREVIAWFQGRSECGPRALGHRSILASLSTPHLKEILNREIKFREGFRPYGGSVCEDEVSRFFEVKEGFKNPFMSFAVKVKEKYAKAFEAICHVDQTSRVQTVSERDNHLFYQLLKQYGKKSGHSVLLNTSLNVMGEPIVETPEDALRFFQQSKVKHLIIGDYLVQKN